MKRSTTLALFLGTAVTLIVLAVDRAGGTRSWERQSIDWRYAVAPRQPRPMSSDIVHVDIDDGALDHVGRWPWSRSRLADVINELNNAGAKTIALDLLLTEPSEPGEVDHDARFAAAIDNASCVLAADIKTSELYDDAWRNSRGAEELGQVLAVLGDDVQLEPDEVMRRAGVSGERRLRYTARPSMFKQAAAWHVLRSAAPPIESFEQFEGVTTPRLDASVGYYPEKPMLETVWRQYRAWRAAEPMLLPGRSRGSFRDKAPLPAFVTATDALGFVTVEDSRDADGVIREVTVTLPTHGGSAVHFAIAAAARFRDRAPRDLTFTDDHITLGETTLPLHDGKLWIDWPTSDGEPRWLGLLRQSPDDAQAAGHLSIREVVELARARVIIESNRPNIAIATRHMLQRMRQDVPDEELLTQRVQRMVADEADFVLADPAPPDDAPPAVRQQYAEALKWRLVSQTISQGEAQLKAVEASLRDKVAGKLVFVGWTATGSIADFFPTAIDEKTPGVVIHAAIANMVLTGDHVRFMPAWAQIAILLAIGMLCTALSAWLPTAPSAVAVTAILGGYGYAATAWVFTQHDTLAPMVGPITAGLAAWVACTALQAALAQRERQRITRQFKARVSTQLVDYLVNNPDAVTVSGDEREMTVLFGDLAGFTTISENLGGRVTVATLNRYMSELTNLLIDHDAYMNKFLGDGLMAFWSAFSVDPKQATKACAAALECQHAVIKLNEDPEFKDIPKLGLRLGIATGRVIVGDCGAPPALNDYTVIGDAVNLAARLESANKQFGTRILINGRTEELLDDTTAATDERRVRMRAIGRIVVVGQSRTVDVFEVVDAEMPDERIKLTEAMASAFREGRLDDAKRFADKLGEAHGDEKLVRVYRNAIEAARNDDAFDGVLRLTDK